MPQGPCFDELQPAPASRRALPAVPFAPQALPVDRGSLGIEAAIADLERRANVRVLRALDLEAELGRRLHDDRARADMEAAVAGRTGQPAEVDPQPQSHRVVAVVDVETTGLDPAINRIIELAVRRVRVDAGGRAVALDRSYAWREDPGAPLPTRITEITGLTDADLVGQAIDGELAARLLADADLIVAHNASFDRPFVERRLPAIADLAWACSCWEVDWRARGANSASLEAILTRCGYHRDDAHRAESDVDATLAVLLHEARRHERERAEAAGWGRTALAELLLRSAQRTWRIEATGSAFEMKDKLRDAGYAWNSGKRVWHREVADEDLAVERMWLEAIVYGPGSRAAAAGPTITEITARTRHR